MNVFAFMTLTAAVWRLEQLHYHQLRLGSTTGAAAASTRSHYPQKKKWRPEPTLWRQRNHITLWRQRGEKPCNFPQEGGKLPALAAARAFEIMTDGQIHTTSQDWWNRNNCGRNEKDWFVWNDCAAGINAGNVWIMLNSTTIGGKHRRVEFAENWGGSENRKTSDSDNK